MRTLLAAVLLAALIVTGVAITVPIVARPLVIAAVQAASPFGDQPLDIEVDLNVFGLLRGTVDRIHVRGTNLTRGDVTIDALDVTLSDVATSGRTFAAASGTLASVAVATMQVGALLDEVRLRGPSAGLSATATLDRAASILLVQSALADAGVDDAGVTLGAGAVGFQVFGARVSVPIGVEDGAIVLVDPLGTGSIDVVRPNADDAWRFTGVSVGPDGMVLDATVDAEKLLAAG